MYSIFHGSKVTVVEITECFYGCNFLLIYHCGKFGSRSFDNMLILAGETPCPRPTVFTPGALLPDVAGRLPAGAGPLPRGDGTELPGLWLKFS